MRPILTGSRALQRFGYKVPANDWDFWCEQEIEGADCHILKPYEQKLYDLARSRGGFVETDFGMAILPSRSVLKAIYLYHYGIRNSRAYTKQRGIFEHIHLDSKTLWAMKEARKGLLQEARAKIFKDSVQRELDHDELHRLVANGTPFREKIPDFSRIVFRGLRHEERLRYIAEEVCVLAKERYSPDSTSDWLFATKLMTVRFSRPRNISLNPVYLSHYAGRHFKEVLTEAKIIILTSPLLK